MEKNPSFPPEIPVHSWAVRGRREGGVAESFLVDRAGLAKGRAAVSTRLRGMGGKLTVQRFWVCFHHLPPSTASRHPRPCRELLKGASPSVLTWGTALPPCAGLPFLQTFRRSKEPSAGPCQSCSAHVQLVSPFPLFNQTPGGCREQGGPMQIPWHCSPPSLPVSYPRGHLKPFFTLAPPATLWSRTLCLGLSSLDAF